MPCEIIFSVHFVDAMLERLHVLVNFSQVGDYLGIAA
jgi:hypothetical protein